MPELAMAPLAQIASQVRQAGAACKGQAIEQKLDSLLDHIPYHVTSELRREARWHPSLFCSLEDLLVELHSERQKPFRHSVLHALILTMIEAIRG